MLAVYCTSLVFVSAALPSIPLRSTLGGWRRPTTERWPAVVKSQSTASVEKKAAVFMDAGECGKRIGQTRPRHLYVACHEAVPLTVNAKTMTERACLRTALATLATGSLRTGDLLANISIIDARMNIRSSFEVKISVYRLSKNARKSRLSGCTGI